MANWVNSIPLDKANTPLQDFPAPVRAIASVMMRENAVASSALALEPTATSLEVNAVGGQGIAIRWVASTETPTVSPRASVISSGLGANFDHIIPAGTYRRFAIPKESGGIGTGTMQAGSTFGLYQRVAQVNVGTGASSVLIIQY